MQILVSSIKGGTGKSTIVAALSQVLDADIIDHDPKGSITLTSHFSGHNKPVKADQSKKEIAIHDTPPYVGRLLRSIIDVSDLIIIPCQLTYADLTSLNLIADELREQSQTRKAIIVFNRVKKPLSKLKQDILTNFKENFRDIMKADTMISESELLGNIWAEKLGQEAKAEFKELVAELKEKKLLKNYA